MLWAWLGKTPVRLFLPAPPLSPPVLTSYSTLPEPSWVEFAPAKQKLNCFVRLSPASVYNISCPRFTTAAEKTELSSCFKWSLWRVKRRRCAPQTSSYLSEKTCDSFFLLRVYWGVKCRAVRRETRAFRFVCFLLRFFPFLAVNDEHSVTHPNASQGRTTEGR